MGRNGITSIDSWTYAVNLPSVVTSASRALRVGAARLPYTRGPVPPPPPASVVLVGRPNVGKSTLFNRISGTRRSIVTPVPGTTRDVITHPASWEGVAFTLTDTGGMFGASEDPLHALVVVSGRRALDAADLLVLVVDGRDGVMPGDEEIARAVRETGRPAVLVVNKTDDKRAQAGAAEFTRLGFSPMFEVSAEHGRGVGDLLDEVVRRLPRRTVAPDDAPGPSDADRRHGTKGEGEATALAVVGRPNAGKSSLVNRLLRDDRMIVSEVPGTTRDAVEAGLAWHGRRFRVIDTAGMRRPGRVSASGPLESLSVLLSKRAITEADVVLMVLDAQAGPTDQDAAIAGAAHEAGAGIVVVANKWDLMKTGEADESKRFDDELRRRCRFLDYAPILHVSALTGERLGKILETVDRVSRERRKRVPTAAFTRFMAEVTAAHPPVSTARRHVRVLYAAQTGVAPPTFVVFTNVATSLHFSYMRFLENRIREAFGFGGSPIRIHVRRRGRARTGRGDQPSEG